MAITRVLHTSDWHLGRSLYGKKRYCEFSSMLDWMLELIEKESIDILLVSGDVFDSTTPGHRAQQLYYSFLCRVAATCCRHVVIIAGNHDSPSFLDAPRELLRAINVFVVGTVGTDPLNEIVVLDDEKGLPLAVVCAVPYLRDRDVRSVEPGEDIDDKNRNLIDGIRRHYENVFEAARRALTQCRRSSSSVFCRGSRDGEYSAGEGPADEHPSKHSAEAGVADRYIPLIAMGHLFTTGGRTLDGDGVRELYVGSLARVGPGIFPDDVDYVALGHLHIPQMVGGRERVRYSGSPIPIGFAEAGQDKKVIIVSFDNGVSGKNIPEIKEVRVPRFQQLLSVSGDFVDICGSVENLLRTLVGEAPESIVHAKSWGKCCSTGSVGTAHEGASTTGCTAHEGASTTGGSAAGSGANFTTTSSSTSAWLEIEYTGREIIPDLREKIEELVAGSEIEVLRVKNKRIIDQVLEAAGNDESLDDLEPEDVFNRCLDAFEVPREQRSELIDSYREILNTIYEEDERE